MPLPREGQAKSGERRGHRGELPHNVEGPMVGTWDGGLISSHTERVLFQSGRLGTEVSEDDDEIGGVPRA